MEFLDWLLKRKDEQSPIGDLARDAARDIKYGGWAPKTKKPKSLHHRMWTSGACSEAEETFDQAVEEWEAEQHA